MNEYQTQNTPDAPWNAPDWSGENHCPECELDYKMDEQADLNGCYEHEECVIALRKMVEDLKAEAYRLSVSLQAKELTVKELESCVRYKEATIQELLEGLESLGRSLNAERGR